MKEQIITYKKKDIEKITETKSLSEYDVFPAALQKISCDKKVGCDEWT